MDRFDFIIIGGGSAGCVLADRLSRDPRHSVLLIEAGPPDRHPFIDMPKGVGKLLFNPKLVWHLSGTPSGGRNAPETWALGKTLGGSSSTNGMVYVRGQPEDYDGWAEAGAHGWGWDAIGAAFKAMEDHQLGEAEWRGTGGPLHVSVRQRGDTLGEAVIAAGVATGLHRKADLNDIDQEGIGYLARTIRRGKRWSAARAFLDPARKRPNLTIVTGTQVDRILFHGSRATGVACSGPKDTISYGANREVIVSAGAAHSPKLLQLSGIGPAAKLRAAGVEMRVDSPGVGANLCEHRSFNMQLRFRRKVGLNHRLRGIGLIVSAARYYLLRSGPLASPAYDVGAFLRSRSDVERPDVQIHAGAPTVTLAEGKMLIDAFPGMRVASYVMRPQSRGSIAIRSSDPRAPAKIDPNFLSAPYDQHTAVDMVRAVRDLLGQPPLLDLGIEELAPTAALHDADEIVRHLREHGGAGHHLAGTCRMGSDAAAVVDLRLRVRGVDGLRVVDCSVMPSLTSGNTNGPVMAIAWLAAGKILEDHQR